MNQTGYSFLMLGGPFERFQIGDYIDVAITKEGPYWVADLQMP